MFESQASRHRKNICKWAIITTHDLQKTKDYLKKSGDTGNIFVN